MNLAASIEGAPAAAPALRGTDGTGLTYGELRAAVARARGALVGAGVRPDDRVVVIAPNGSLFVVAFLAVLGVGAVAVPLNPSSPDDELVRECEVVEPAAVIVDAAVSVERLHDFGVVLDGPALTAGAPTPDVPRDTDDLAVLVFTSGTAGLPRAAKLTHGNLLANIAQVQAHPGRAVVSTDVVLGVLPLFHIFGLTVSLGVTMAAGASLVLVPRFDPQETLALCAREHVTLVAGSPTMFAALTAAAADPAGAGPGALADVRLALSGAAPLPARIAEEFTATFGLPVHQGYGLTEASPVVTSSVLHERPSSATIGVPLPGIEVRIVDNDGIDALAGDPGELWVRGANVFGGYWNDDAATRAVLTPDGWLRTGDLAVTDELGRLQIVDRKKDLIIVNGFNVVPAEVEEVLADHPAVAEAAVVGVPDARTGEAVRAVVVAAGTAPTLAELAAHCAQRLARYKCPTQLEVVESLPHGQGGKLLRRAVR